MNVINTVKAMLTSQPRYKIGNAEITKILDTELHNFTPGKLLPQWDASVFASHPEWFPAESIDRNARHLLMSVHSWLVRENGRTVLVDTATGNHKNRPYARYFHQLHTPYLERLKRAGVEPNEVDYVLTTHVHVDHVGWNTYLKDGVWLPTFPNARYIFSRDEHEFFTNPANFNDETRTSFAAQQDSVLPIMAAGLADPIGIDDTAPIPGFTFIATPGHSPFHASIMMESAGQKALFCGDIVHHPIQMHQPEWSAVFDSDPKTAVATRRRIMDLVADENIQLFTPHFTGTSTGWVTKDGANYTWRFAE